MHGRQKVQQTVEEEEKKAKERSKKLLAYQDAMKRIFGKRSNKELDQELLQLTGKLLTGNPDIGTLWNLRKECLQWIRNDPEINFGELVTKELELSEVCLKSNPKSYGAWHHRCWLMKETDFVRVSDELKLCSRYLKFDDRNFHCWDYRRYLLDNSPSGPNLTQELKFTTEKIVSNFSNYSSWHLRSTLLPKISPDFLREELELIKNAAFTDPSDQSVWFYHRWLLKSQLTQESPKLLYAFSGAPKGNSALMCVFNIPVLNPSGLTEVLNGFASTVCAEIFQSKSWWNPWSSTRSKLWVLEMRKMPPEIVHKIATSCEDVSKHFDIETQPKSSELQSILRSELNWVIELNELEPDNKWILATWILLMRLIDHQKFYPQISDCLDKLIELDPNRTNYYMDLRSKYIMEDKIVNLPLETEEVDLSNLGLTSVYYLERLCAVKGVSLSGNLLHESISLSALLSCEHLILQK